jgi:surface protein
MLLSVIGSRHRNVIETAFVTTQNIVANGETLTLPVTKDYPIDWGDGTVTTSGNSHVYSTLGVYTVKMYGVVDDFGYNGAGDKDKILTVENFGGFVDKGEAFSGCSQLLLVADNYIVQYSSFRNFLTNCSSLVGNISNWDVSNISNMSYGLSGLTVFNQDLSNWDVSNSSSFQNTFYNAKAFNQDLSNWDVSNVSSFQSCFYNALAFNNDSLKNWDYSSATIVATFMLGKRGSNYNYQYYDNLLIKWDSDPSLGGLDFAKLTNLTTNFGTIQYSSAGAAAHASLTTKGLIISDGGQNAF